MDVVDSDDGDLDPRIQIELENLNTATDEINRLEIELDEANTTFRILLNECTRRLKQKSKLLGSCVEKARPYYEALEVARQAQLECQRAAVQYQRANEIHQAAKETVALAEQRFLSKQHEWQFDNAWQEMLNHATIKVRDAETQKAESGREHHKRALLFHAAEQKVNQLEQRLHRHIIKSRPYFEEKSLCNGQLAAQKERVETLQTQVAAVKNAYAGSLKELERISEEIHCKRNQNKQVDRDLDPPCGPREPGVGAELTPIFSESLMIVDDFSLSSLSLRDKTSNVIEDPLEHAPFKESQTLTFDKVDVDVNGSTVTSLPLLESLAQLKQSNSCEVLDLNSSSSQRNLHLSPDISSPTVSLESAECCGTEKVSLRNADEKENLSAAVCSSSLLNHLMENYISELDGCDIASLGSSSAVSEKDENQVQVEEELHELRGQIHELSSHAFSREIPSCDSGRWDVTFQEKLSPFEKECLSANQTPKKTLGPSMSLPSLLLSSESERPSSYVVDLCDTTLHSSTQGLSPNVYRK